MCLAILPGLAYGASAIFHAALLHSTPAADSHLTNPPETIRLVFSEPVVADLSSISLVGPDLKAIQLKIATDPHDVHTLVGPVGPILDGRYSVVWHVLSADGHRVGGTFAFTVRSHGTSPASAPAIGASTTPALSVDSVHGDSASTSSTSSTMDTNSTPILASVVRGAGLGAMMAAVGLLFFSVTGREPRRATPAALVIRLTAVGAILLVTHMIAWLANISPTGGFSTGFIGSALGSTPGELEAARVALALLTLWAIALARRESLALILGACCLVISGAIGHPAAIHPEWSMPSKAIHLIAGAAWLGGLLWIGAVIRRDDANFPAEARRVSAVAVVSVFAILFTGVVQTWVFLNTPGDLIHSWYGRLAAIKMIGLLALLGFGAFNRFLILPAIEDPGVRPGLTRTVRQEIGLVTVLILIGGFLAYVPTPTPPGSQTARSTPIETSR